MPSIVGVASDWRIALHFSCVEAAQSACHLFIGADTLALRLGPGLERLLLEIALHEYIVLVAAGSEGQQLRSCFWV